MGSGATTRVIEQTVSYRDEVGTFDEVVAKLTSNGWVQYLDHPEFSVFRHPQMPGHSRTVEQSGASA